MPILVESLTSTLAPPSDLNISHAKPNERALNTLPESTTMSIPTTLTPKQAEQLTDLLRQARKQLRDAAGSRIYLPNYASTSSLIADTLRKLGVDPD